MVFLNEKNLLQPPISVTLDRVKSECSALRRSQKLIRLGICRIVDQSLLNPTTIQHLGSLTFDEFQQISVDEPLTPSLNTSRKSIVNSEKIKNDVEPKRRSHFFSSKKKYLQQKSSTKRNSSPNRDSGFIETDGKAFYFLKYEILR